MSDLQAYYENFATQPSRWAAHDEEECGCRGRGWFLSELDTWHRCPFHGKNVPHPEDEREDTHMPAEEGEFVMRPSTGVVDTTVYVNDDPSADDDIPF